MTSCIGEISLPSWIISSLTAEILYLLKDKPSRVIDSPLYATLQCTQKGRNQYLSTCPGAGGEVSGLQTLVCRNKGIQEFRPTGLCCLCLGLCSGLSAVLQEAASPCPPPTVPVLTGTYPAFYCHACGDSPVQQLKQ